MEVYVNDIIIKNMRDEEFLSDIKEKMVRLRETNMNLNPKKCAISAQKGRFFMGFEHSNTS